MSADVFNLKVFTPAGLVLEEKTSSVTMVSKNGEIGVLPQHIKYNGLLGTGVFQFVPAAGGAVKRLVVAEGFATFTDDELLILADFVVFPDEVDRTANSQRRATLQEKVDSLSAYEPEWQMARDELSRAEAIDALVG